MYGDSDLNPSLAGEVEGYIRGERMLETLRISRSDSGSRQARVELEYILIALQTKMFGRTLFRAVGLCCRLSTRLQEGTEWMPPVQTTLLKRRFNL